MTHALLSRGRSLLVALAPVLLRLVTALVTGAVLTVLVPVLLVPKAASHAQATPSRRTTHALTTQHVPEPPTTTLLALGVAAMVGAAAHGWRSGGRLQEDW